MQTHQQPDGAREHIRMGAEPLALDIRRNDSSTHYIVTITTPEGAVEIAGKPQFVLDSVGELLRADAGRIRTVFLDIFSKGPHPLSIEQVFTSFRFAILGTANVDGFIDGPSLNAG